MKNAIAQELGQQLRLALRSRGLTQGRLAHSLGRPSPRLSELLSDLERQQPRRDRLNLLMEICDALDLAIVLVPRSRLSEVSGFLEPAQAPALAGDAPRSVFDEIFVDLSDDDHEDDEDQGRRS